MHFLLFNDVNIIFVFLICEIFVRKNVFIREYRSLVVCCLNSINFVINFFGIIDDDGIGVFNVL